MEVTEWDAPVNSAVQKRSREEATALDRGGGEEGHRQGIQRLWAPPGYGDLLPIPGTGDLRGGQQLAGGSQELVLGEGGVEEDDENPHQGGGGDTGVWIFL